MRPTVMISILPSGYFVRISMISAVQPTRVTPSGMDSSIPNSNARACSG